MWPILCFCRTALESWQLPRRTGAARNEICKHNILHKHLLSSMPCHVAETRLPRTEGCPLYKSPRPHHQSSERNLSKQWLPHVWGTNGPAFRLMQYSLTDEGRVSTVRGWDLAVGAILTTVLGSRWFP